MSLARNSAGGRSGLPRGWIRLVLVLVVVAVGVYMSRREEAAKNDRPAPADIREDEQRPADDQAAEVAPPAATSNAADDRATDDRTSANQPANADPAPAPRSTSRPPPAAAEEQVPAERGATIVANQKIYDLDRQLIYEGDIDIGPTLARIDAGRRLRFPNDGATFQNRERRLPRQPADYYREYVHPTDELLPSPGPQRIVIGEAGETYYTPDHYKTFRRVDRPE
jgi:ribonuclease T1